jgi:hypothetical protein
MAAVITPAMSAVYKPRTSSEDVYTRLRDWAGDAAILLVEGDLDGPGTKVEIWREKVGGNPLALERADIASVVTDDPVSINIPVWPRRDIALLANRILHEATPFKVDDETSLTCPF